MDQEFIQKRIEQQTDYIIAICNNKELSNDRKIEIYNSAIGQLDYFKSKLDKVKKYSIRIISGSDTARAEMALHLARMSTVTSRDFSACSTDMLKSMKESEPTLPMETTYLYSAQPSMSDTFIDNQKPGKLREKNNRKKVKRKKAKNGK